MVPPAELVVVSEDTVALSALLSPLLSELSLSLSELSLSELLSPSELLPLSEP